MVIEQLEFYDSSTNHHQAIGVGKPCASVHLLGHLHLLDNYETSFEASFTAGLCFGRHHLKFLLEDQQIWLCRNLSMDS